jgi:cytochrome c553
MKAQNDVVKLALLSQKISVLVGVIILFLPMFLFYSLRNKETAIDPNIPRAWCGNSYHIKPGFERYNLGNNVSKGKELFLNNCAQCHAKDMHQKLTGPGLSGVAENWSKYPPRDLYNFIRNSQKMIKNKHPRAVKVYHEYNNIEMNSFNNLSDDDISSILVYIARQSG